MRALRWGVGGRRATTVGLVVALVLGAGAVAGAAVLGTGGGATATALAAMCGTDEFDGSTLDDARWDVLRPVPAGLNVAGGKLNIELSNTDLISGTATAQNLALQDAPAGGWTATTKFNIASIDTNGEQAGLALWKSEGPPNANNVFAKATFIQVSSGEAGTRRFESIWTDGGGLAVPIPSSQTPPVTVALDADLLMRMRSDGRTVTAEYSLNDGGEWTQIGRTARYSGTLRVGPLALRGATGGGFIPFERFDLACGPDVSVAASTTSGAAPLAVDLTGTVGAGGQNLAWDFGDGSTAAGGTTQSHTFTQPGTYRVTLAADANGATTRGSTLVTVLATAPPCPATNDEFAGNALDPKWQVLRPRLTGLDVAGGNLRLHDLRRRHERRHRERQERAAPAGAGRPVDGHDQDRHRRADDDGRPGGAARLALGGAQPLRQGRLQPAQRHRVLGRALEHAKRLDGLPGQRQRQLGQPAGPGCVLHPDRPRTAQRTPCCRLSSPRTARRGRRSAEASRSRAPAR